MSIVNRSNSISSSISDESSNDLLTTPCLSPSVLVTDEQKITEKKDDSYHVLYVHLNGEYVPIAKTSFIIQTSLPTLNSSESSLKEETAPVRTKNYRCDYPGCTKAYYKSSHLKAHMRLHTGKSIVELIFLMTTLI